jgi:DNA polymerase-1
LIVTRDNFFDVLSQLSHGRPLAVDTETSGLRTYHGDRPFSVVLHDGEEAYYFNFNVADDISPLETLDWRIHGPLLRDFFATFRLYFLHNSKFDMAMLARMGISLSGVIHDTMVVARVLDSTLWQGDFSLDACGKRLGYEKLDTVKNYLLDNKLFTVERLEGKKTSKKLLHFDKAPWDLIAPYAMMDAEITFRLAERQLQDIEDAAASTPVGLPSLEQVYKNECRLVRTVFDMEERGVLIDRDFCARAIVQAETDKNFAEAEFERHTGQPFKDSGVLFKLVFGGLEDKWVYGKPTPTGKVNPSFDSDVLGTFDHPAAKAVIQWRKAKSDSNYFHGFLYEADAGGVIHTSFNQHVAATGRFSSSNPNLQNLTKSEDAAAEEFLVRRAIVPRPGMVFHMLDFEQMEYRLMLDYAARFAADREGVLSLIEKVLGGLDVHQATADVAGISRRDAKTVNFATLYGSGVANLAARLGRPEHEARAIRDSIFRAAPEIGVFIRRVTKTAEERGFIVNWYGRRCAFPDPRHAYRAPNYLIQGGCADVVKVAMNRIDDHLRGYQTRLVLCIHDEICVEGPPEEAAVVIPEIKRIMEQAYPATHVPLTCDVEHSHKSLADKEEGVASCVKH